MRPISVRRRADRGAGSLELQVVIARENARFAAVDPPFAAERGIDIVLGATPEEMQAFFGADPAMQSPRPPRWPNASRTMMTAWAAFARSGTPELPGLARPRYDTIRRGAGNGFWPGRQCRRRSRGREAQVAAQ